MPSIFSPMQNIASRYDNLTTTSSSSTTSTIASNLQPYTSAGGILTIGTTTTTPYNTNGTVPYWNSSSGLGAHWSQDIATPLNLLKNLDYSSEFDLDKNDILSGNLKGIRKNKFLFNCQYDGNRIQPYEFIMKLINQKNKMSVTIHVSDILSICYTNLQFIKIENNLNFDTNCDFSVLKVKFKYDSILYENHKLSEKEMRSDKLKKIMSNEDNNN